MALRTSVKVQHDTWLSQHTAKGGGKHLQATTSLREAASKGWLWSSTTVQSQYCWKAGASLCIFLVPREKHWLSSLQIFVLGGWNQRAWLPSEGWPPVSLCTDSFLRRNHYSLSHCFCFLHPSLSLFGCAISLVCKGGKRLFFGRRTCSSQHEGAWISAWLQHAVRVGYHQSILTGCVSELETPENV